MRHSRFGGGQRAARHSQAPWEHGRAVTFPPRWSRFGSTLSWEDRTGEDQIWSIEEGDVAPGFGATKSPHAAGELLPLTPPFGHKHIEGYAVRPATASGQEVRLTQALLHGPDAVSADLRRTGLHQLQDRSSFPPKSYVTYCPGQLTSGCPAHAYWRALTSLDDHDHRRCRVGLLLLAQRARRRGSLLRSTATALNPHVSGRPWHLESSHRQRCVR